MLARKIFSITDALSTSLQATQMTASKARAEATEICDILTEMRTEADFNSFIENVDKLSDKPGRY